MKKLAHRSTKYLFKIGKFARNRIIVPPMASETADLMGFATISTISHYAKLAEAGAAVVMVEYSYVHPSGKSEAHQLGIDHDDKVNGLSKIAQTIKETGALAAIQLTHSGGKSTMALTQNELMAPSAVAVPVKNQKMEIPRAMSAHDVLLWKFSFLEAARRANQAGFDMIELHAAHGYGLNQWISPIINHRKDLYGGSFENRSRLLFEIFGEIRKNFPKMLLSVRIPGHDSFEDGLGPEDAARIAIGLQVRGIDLVHVSSGMGGWRRPKERSGEGYLVPEAEFIQSKVSVPVIGVGGIQTGEYIDQLLSKGSVSFVAVGRAILIDPVGWRKGVLPGASE